MKKVYLHIGTGKTGTSTIQNTLYINRKVLRDQYSIDYANIYLKSIEHFGEIISAHYPLVDKIKSRSDSSIKKILGYINHSPCKSFIFSCENFYHLLSQDDIEWLSSKFENLNVTIICYVRRQDLYIESAYRQQVKVGEFKMSFEDFLYRHTTPSYLDQAHANYHKMVGKWSDAFGKKHIIVRPFDPDFFVNNSLIDDFFHILKINPRVLTNKYSGNSNETLPLELINLIRLFNSYQIVPRDEQQKFVQFLRSSYHFQDGSLLSKQCIKNVLNNYYESNVLLCNEYSIPKEWFINDTVTPKAHKSLRPPEEIFSGFTYTMFKQISRPSRMTRMKIRLFFLSKDIAWMALNFNYIFSFGAKPNHLRLKHRMRMILNGDFSPTFYLSKYTDVRDSGIDPFVHYYENGQREKRLPHPSFSRNI